jgi:uncharacterized membrane-anchored protein
MTRYRGLIVALIIVAAIGGVVFYALTEFPQLIPSHTIPRH